MKESKIDLTHRLQKDGRWAEASAFKDEVKNRLRGEGLKRAEAGEKAWAEMAAEYPPLPETDGDGESNAGDGDLADPKKKYEDSVDRYYHILARNTRDIIASFVSHFEVELTDDARQTLEDDIVRLVDDYVQGISGRDWAAEAESLSADECVLAGAVCGTGE